MRDLPVEDRVAYAAWRRYTALDPHYISAPLWEDQSESTREKWRSVADAALAAASAPEEVDAQIDAAFVPYKPPPVTMTDPVEDLIRMRDSDALANRPPAPESELNIAKEQAQFWRKRCIEVDAHRRLLVKSVNELISIRRTPGYLAGRIEREQAVWQVLADLADWKRYRPHTGDVPTSEEKP